MSPRSTCRDKNKDTAFLELCDQLRGDLAYDRVGDRIDLVELRKCGVIVQGDYIHDTRQLAS